MKSVYLILILLIGLAACKKELENPGNKVGFILGTWLNPQYGDSTVSYQKSLFLKDQEYGISFLPDSEFIERKIAGWCATPPVYYADFKGTWTRTDSIINISVAYWGGMIDYQWKILFLDSKTLTIRILKVEPHPQFE
jgi:hypothetical protein